ncbi:MAG: hypothetical protein WBG46_09075 [Nonlabens sp.]
MRIFITLLVTLTLGCMANAQVGINTETPRALLDIKAANEIADNAGVMVTDDGVLIPRVTTLLVNADQPIEGLLIYLTETFEDTSSDPSTFYEPGFYVSYGSTWETFGNGSGDSLGQLRLVDEGNGDGFRLAPADPLNYGDLGQNAVDLSIQNSASSINGATGQNAFAVGLNTRASAINSVAIGSVANATGNGSIAFGSTVARSAAETSLGTFNTDYTPDSATSIDTDDRLLVVGNGTSDLFRSDAFVILKDGVVTAPSMGNAEIEAAGNDVLVTKGYLSENSGSGQLEAVNEGNTLDGYRILGADPNNYGDIGSYATDLSFQQSASTTTGSTGEFSFAANVDNTAAGDASSVFGISNAALGTSSFATGQDNTATGDNSAAFGAENSVLSTRGFVAGFENNVTAVNAVAFGRGNVASGENSAALGEGTLASANKSTVVGEYNTDYSVEGNGTDRLFVVGNGGTELSRQDALIVRKDGLVTAPSMDNTDIDNAGDEVLITKGYLGEVVNNDVFTGIEQVTEGGNTGLRRSDADAANFGDIGSSALDLSVSFAPSTTRGATGDLSIALGAGTIASGRGATAMGRRTEASGRFATAIGEFSTASGVASAAIGLGLISKSNGEVALGAYNTDYTVADNDTDRVLVIGNGADNSSRADALIVQKNGLVLSPSLSVTQIENADEKALTTKEFTNENYIGKLESGDTASRPSSASFGTIRYNTQTGRPEVYVENSTNLPEGSTYIPGWIDFGN